MTSISRRHGLQALRRLREGAHALVADWRLPWAVAMHRKGRLGAARAVYRRILLRAPRHFDVLQLMGLVALQRRRFREALAWFEQALALRPDDAMLHNHIGCAYRNAGLHEAAERHLLRARALAPHAFEPACNLGLLRASRHDIAGARAAYEEAARIDPSRPEPLHGLAHLLVDTHCLPAAIAAFDQLCARDPDDRAAWFGKTLALLLAGDLAQANRLQQLGGDAARRGRRHLFSQRRPGGVPWGRHLACPEWQGDTPVAGRTVLVHAEAGYGDAIQYARFVPVLASRGARVVLEVQPPLKGLLAALPGAAAVVARGDALPAHDLHIALEDLPIALDATQDNLPPPALALSQGRAHGPSQDLSRVLPAGLRADWAARLGPRLGALRVGLACSGNPLHERDRERSLPLALMLGFFAWMGLARFVRTEFLTLREREFVDAARVAGASNRRIIFKHILPNAVGVIIVAVTLLMSGAILLESALSFLGFGVVPPDVSLGQLINQYQNAFTTRPWLFWWPGFFIISIALSINFIGDGLRDAFDPRQKRRITKKDRAQAREAKKA